MGMAVRASVGVSDHVEALEPALHLAEELRARQQRPADRLAGGVLAELHLPQQRRAQLVAPLAAAASRKRAFHSAEA